MSLRHAAQLCPGLSRPGLAAIGAAAAILLGANASALDPAPGPWPLYNKSYDGQRYSTLAQINRGNVEKLGPVCAAELGDAGSFQAGPVVIGESIYLTTANSTVAIDARSCQIRWQNIYKGEEPPVFAANKGVGFADGRVFRGTPDGRLLCIDAASGRTLWKLKAADPSVGEFFSAAPIAWMGLLYIGIAGSDWGVQGRMMAFDAATGKEIWRFNTIPQGSEPGAETWKNPPGLRVGGGGSWSTYTLDPETGELFVPVGNPAPMLRSDLRGGKNLYTDSVLVLDAKSGKLRWYFQLTGNDGFDLDLGAAPVLYSTAGGRSMVAAGSKDGYLYGIDRATHRLSFQTAVTTVNGPDNLKMPPPAGVTHCPGYLGGVEWNGPAFDPTDQSIFVGAVDWCMVFKPGEAVYHPPGLYHGGVVILSPGDLGKGWITSINGNTGEVRWNYRSQSPIVAAITPTAGGVVFAGDALGTFFALDTKTGQPLFKHDMGGAMNGGIVTYELKGTQYVAVTSGSTSRSGLGNGGAPTLTIFALAEQAPALIRTRVEVDPLHEKLATLDAKARGSLLFGHFCATCHAPDGRGGIGPDLTKLGDAAVVRTFVKAPVAPMPKLYPAVLSDENVDDIAAHVAALAAHAAEPAAGASVVTPQP